MAQASVTRRTRGAAVQRAFAASNPFPKMLDPKHDTKPGRIQAALAALGKRIVVTFEDAA